MKKTLVLLIIFALLSLPLYAEEGEGQVDEVEAVEQKQEPEPGPGTEAKTEDGETNTEADATQDTESAGEAESTEELESTGEAESSQETELSGAVGEEAFIVMDEEGSLIASSGAGYTVDPSSMMGLFVMAALDEKYGKDGDMGRVKVAEDFESSYDYGLELTPGEEFGATDLYKTLFLQSSSDAILLFAKRDFQGGEGLVSYLNTLSSKLGLNSTHINGLEAGTGSSTLYDMGRLFIHNYRTSERFREAAVLKKLSIPETETTGSRLIVSSSAFVVDKELELGTEAGEVKVYDEAVLAAKTGYTEAGGYILLTVLTNSNKSLLFMSGGGHDLNQAYLRHKLLQNKILEDYEAYPYLKANSPIKAVKGEGEERTMVEMSPKSDVLLFLPKGYDVKTGLECRYRVSQSGGPEIAIYKEGSLFKLVDATASDVISSDSYLGEVKDLEKQKNAKDKAFNLVKIGLKLLLTLILWVVSVALNRWRIRAQKRKTRNKSRVR